MLGFTGVRLSNELCLTFKLFLRGEELWCWCGMVSWFSKVFLLLAAAEDFEFSRHSAFLEMTMDRERCFSLNMYGTFGSRLGTLFLDCISADDWTPPSLLRISWSLRDSRALFVAIAIIGGGTFLPCPMPPFFGAPALLAPMMLAPPPPPLWCWLFRKIFSIWFWTAFLATKQKIF